MPRRKPWLNVSAAFAATYLGYILWSKYAKTIGPPPIKLDEIGEFLLFLAAVVAFTLQVFVEDRGNVPTDEVDQA